MYSYENGGLLEFEAIYQKKEVFINLTIWVIVSSLQLHWFMKFDHS